MRGFYSGYDKQAKPSEECKHIFVDTGMRKTWCKKCDCNGEYDHSQGLFTYTVDGNSRTIKISLHIMQQQDRIKQENTIVIDEREVNISDEPKSHPGSIASGFVIKGKPVYVPPPPKKPSARDLSILRGTDAITGYPYEDDDEGLEIS